MTKEIETADVSVIIPAFRAADTIGRALASVAAQTCTPREVIVVHDESDDGTADAAEAMRGALGPIALRIIRQPYQGDDAARNSALALANGALVTFLDADDEWLPEKLARSLPHLENPADMTGEGERGRQRPLEAMLWLWTAAVIVAYMVQFRPYLAPVAQAIGLS